MKLNLGYLKSLWLKKPWSRVAAAVFFIIPLSVALLWFSVNYRLPVIKHITDEVTLPSKLKAEIDTAKLNWREEESKITRSRWDEIRKKVPDSYDKLSNLIEGINLLASSSGLKMSYKLGDLKPAYEGIVGFSLLPIDVKLRVVKPGAGLKMFINLIKDIVGTYYGFDIADITMVGEGNGIKEMDINFILWVGFQSETVKL